MSKDWNSIVAQAEAAAQDKQALEDAAHSRFDAVRAHGTDTPEFREWIAAAVRAARDVHG